MENNINQDLREAACDDGTGSGSCLMAGFGISGVKIMDSAIREEERYGQTTR
jgi:hypothetical protein